MKPVLQTLVTLGILFSMISCQDTSVKIDKPEKEEVPTITMASLTTKKLDPKDAGDWIQNWKDNSTQYMAKNSIEYFDMPMDDLRAVTSQNGVTKARYYMGLEEKTAGREISYTPHLILVGLTKKNGLDYANLNEAYDYSSVCPPFCSLIPPTQQ